MLNTRTTAGFSVNRLQKFPEELKSAVIQILLARIDRDTAEKKMAELIQNLEFDITAAELSAYPFKLGHA
ncbi:hypothetical protein [Enterobacter hormaechei]|uniref:hypothetical protein n=1 Tax=Enterobacter hormaechei TaxID=158836 RepID=UPI003315BEC8